MFAVRFARGAVEDLENVGAYARARILDTIERSLRTHPLDPRRSRKELVGLVPPWEHVAPVWELRVGDYRVFYDVDTERRQVVGRAIRHKGRRTREEIL